MMTPEPHMPDDAALAATVFELRAAHPELGITKLLNLVKNAQPTWAVSEKRLKKILAAAVSSNNNGKERDLVAETGIDNSLDVAALAPKVKIKMFAGGKGKGLVAKETIQRGEMIWQEEPWTASPDPQLYPLLLTRKMCTFCLTLFARPDPPLSVPCPSCDTAHFCNRLCLSRAAASAHHPLLCPGANPSGKDLMSVVASNSWRALDVVAKIVAKWRLERERSPESAAELEQRVWAGMARVDMEKREMEKKEWEYVGEMQQRQWKIGHALLITLLNPGTKAFTATLGRLGKKSKPAPLTDIELERWFSYSSFLQLIGLANLNQEDSGGLYALHAHLNHNCEPNVMVRNLPKTFIPPTSDTLPCDPPPPNGPGVRGTNKITIIARKTLSPGEELCVTYVNPEMDVEGRRQALREGYGFWCRCARCVRELKAMTKGDANPGAEPAAVTTADAMA